MAKRTALDILRGSFSREEWESLERDPVFRSAVANLKSMDDLERVSKLGDSLVRIAAEQRVPGIPRSSSRREPP